MVCGFMYANSVAVVLSHACDVLHHVG